MSASIRTLEIPALAESDRRLSLIELIEVAGGQIPPNQTTASLEERMWAEPAVIQHGLFIDPADPTIYQPHISRLQLNAEADDGKNMAGVGVAFPAAEVAVVNPPSYDTQEKLTTTQLAQSHLLTRLAYDRLGLVDLYRDLSQSDRERLKAKNLDPKRRKAELTFHEGLDVAAATLHIDAAVLESAHLALQHSLYSPDKSPEELVQNWLRHLTVAGLHNTAKRYKLHQAIARSGRELARLPVYFELQDHAELAAT